MDALTRRRHDLFFRCRDNPALPIDHFDTDELQAMTYLRKREYVDGQGNVSLEGMVEMISKEFSMMRFEVLIVAYVYGGGPTSSIGQFEARAIWRRKQKTIQNNFYALVGRGMLRRIGHTVYAVSDLGRTLLARHSEALHDIRRSDLLLKEPFYVCKPVTL